MSIWLYERTDDNLARFVLGELGKNPLVCIGINPSIAKPYYLDNTLTSVKRIATENDFDSWIMLNVYPQRKTDPDKIHKDINRDIHERNQQSIEIVMKSFKIKHVWAAWGANITKRDYLKDCLNDIFTICSKFNINWYDLGNKTKDGHPHHPLRLKKELKLNKFDMNSYMKNLS